MQKFLAQLQDIVWPAVFAAVLAPACIITAFLAPETPILAVSLGLAGITMGLLATRA
jgi:hypothetical protein